MKRTSTPLEMFKKTLLLFICFTTITLFHAKLYGQAKERVYARTSDEGTSGLACVLCGISNKAAAVDVNPNTFSTINVGVGLGGYYQELIYPAAELPGASRGSVVKLSAPSIVTINLGAISVQAYNGNRAVGAKVLASSGLISLLASGNETEVFLPAPNAAYDRVRVTVGGVSAVNSINVFHSYYLKDATNINCDGPIDQLSGITSNLVGIGGVTNPLNAIDGNNSTYSLLGAVAGLAGYTQQTIIFPGLSQATDSVNLRISSNATLLSADLLKSVMLVFYAGGDSVASTKGVSESLLSLKLLSGADKEGVLSYAPGVKFDRVQLRVGGLLSVLSQLNLHEVSRSMALPTSININNTASPSGIACMGDGVTLSVTSPEQGAIYTWYTTADGGTGTTGTTFPLTGLTSGVHNFYVTGKRAGCTNETPRKLVRVVVNNPTLPVVSTTNTICAGSPITLKVTSPIVGETYRWYDVSTGGTAVFTGTDFTTPVLTAGKSYYVESVIGTCVSARAKVDVTVNPMPGLADIITKNVSISKGQTAILVAAPKTADAGSNINWYTQATGGSPIATGNTFTTPALNADITYYVEVQTAGGCVSPTRVPVLVTVTDIAPGLACNAANRQSNGIEGLLCVACGVTNPGSAVDADPTTFSTLNLAVGVGGQVYQRLLFPGVGSATDSIRVKLLVPGGLLDASLLGGTSLSVMRNGVAIKTYQMNSTLLHLTVLGGDAYYVTIPAGAAYDAVEVRIGAVVTALTAVNVYGAEVVYANPTIANAGLNICAGADATITATPAAGTSLKWYAAPTGGTALFSGNEFKPTGLAATTTYYIEVGNATGTCVNAVRMPVTVNVNPAITFAASTLAKGAVGSNYSKQITAATGGTPVFKYTIDAGSNLPAGLTMSDAGVISGKPTTVGKYTFTVVATDSKGCIEKAAITLEVTGALTIATAPLPNGTTGVVYPTQTLPEATGGTGPYTYTATNLPPGLVLDPATREITGTPTKAGTYPVVVTVKDADGNTVNQNYSIIVRDPLVLATAPLADGTVGVTYPTQTLPAATGGVGPYTYTASNLPPGLTFDPATREITGTPTTAGPYTVAVTVKDGDGKTVTTNYTINVKSPLVLATATLPDGNVGVVYPTQTLPEATGGTGPYTYAAATMPPGLSFDPATRKITGTPTQSGLYTIPVTVTDKAGNKVTTNYNIRVIGALSLPAATLANGTVGTAYTAQTIPAVSGGTSPYTYEVKPTDLPPGLTFNTTTRTISGTPTKGGSYTFPVTAKDAAGNSTTTDYTILVKVNAPVVAAIATCEGQTATLTVTSPIAGVVYNWYAATGTTPLATGTSYTTAEITTNTTYYVTAVSGTETSARTAVTVTARPAPESAVVSSGQFISAGQTATLQASVTAGNTINWFAAATGGTALGTGTSFTTPALNTTTTYYVETQNAAGCVSLTRVPVTVTVTTGPGNPDCNAANAQVSKIESLVCLLCGITNPTGSIDADPNTFTTINLGVNVAGVGYQKLIFGKQGAATDSISIDMEIPVGLADINLISGGTITVYNGNTAVKVYPMNSSLLNLQVLGGNRIKATLPATGAFNAVEIRVGAVANVLTNYRIYGATIVYPNPTLAAAGQTICAGNTATLTATANGGTTLNWYAAATGGTSLGTGESFTTPVLSATTIYYIEVSKAGCANAQRIPVTVNVTPAPTAPVLATVAPVCYGSTTSIAIDNPIAGVEYKWYTVSTGGTAVFTGDTFVTPALTANTTYYVEATNPGCGVSSRTAVPVTVNPMIALPQVQASATTVVPGQTVILTAGPINPDVTFNWYTTANGTTPVFTGPVFVTPQLMATTTYYVEAKSDLTGCVSTSRVQVTINVDGNGNPNPVPCEGAITQTNAVSGVALLSGVFNPELAIDNDTKTGSSLVMTVGALGASVSQTVGFGSVSTVGDTVKVLLSAPGKLLSVGLLSNIQVGTYNGATSNNDALAINDHLINLELLSGDSQALLTFVPAAPFDKVEVRLNAGLAGVLTTVDLNYAQRLAIAPTITVANPTTCEGAPITLAVNNPNPAVTYKWYDSTGAKELATGASFSPTITATTTYYVAAITGSGCVSYKTKVVVTVTPAPEVPKLVADNIKTCPNTDVTLTVKDPVAGVTYKWYKDGTVYQTGKDGISFTIVGVTGNATYSVEAYSATCGLASVSKATATIEVGALSVPIITPENVTIKSGTSAGLLASSSTAGVIFKWYSDPALTTLVNTGNTFQTPVLNNTSNVNLIVPYYVTGEIAGGCPANGYATVNVTVLPHVDGTDIPCEGATVQVRGGVDGVAILAGLFNPERAVDNDTETASSLVMPVGALGASVYQHVGFKGLSIVGDTVKIRVTSPGKLLSLGVLPSIEFTTYAGTVSNNDMLIANNPLINLELISGDSDYIFSFVPQKQFDGVEVRLRSGLASVLSTLDLNYAQRKLAAPKVTSANATACEGTAATLSVQSPAPAASGITYTWHTADGTKVGDGITYTTATTLTVGTHEFFLRANRNNCASAQTKVTVTILAAPDAPVAVTGNPKTTCPNVPVTLAVEKVAGVSYNWFDALTGGNQLASNTDTYTAAATLAPGVYDFYVEAANANSCVSTDARTKITLTVKRLSTPADVTVTGADVAVCKDAKVTLTANSTTVQNPIFVWFSDKALTTEVARGKVYEPTVTATTTFYVSVSGDNVCDGGAANAKPVTVVVNPTATAADLTVTGNADPLCAGATAALTAKSTTVTNPVFTWYTDKDLKDAVHTGATYNPVLTKTTTYYVTVHGDNKCPNLAADAKVVTVKVNDFATAADITVSGNGKPFCNGTEATLTATSTTVTNPTFIWYSDADLKTEVFRGAVYKTIVTATTNYYVTVSGDNRCPNDAVNAKVVTLTVNPPATAADITVTGSDAPFCKGTKASLIASSTTVTNPVFTWYTDADLTNAVFTGAKFEPIVTATVTYYVTVRGDNKCESVKATAKVITLVVNPPALSTDITVTGNENPLCNGTKALLKATSTVKSPVFNWYTDAALTKLAFTGPVYEPTVTATTTYYVTVSGADKCENLAGEAKIVTVIVNPPAVAADIILAGADLPICAGATVTLTAKSTTVTNPVFTWYTDAALSNAVHTGATYQKAISATTTFYVTVKGANKCENLPNTGKSITVTVNATATAADLNVTGNGTPFCAGQKASLTAKSTTVTNPVFTWYTDAALTNAVHTGPVYEPTVTVTTTYYVTVHGDNKCPNLAADAAVVKVTVNKTSGKGDLTVEGGDAPFCKGTTANLTAKTTTVTNPVFTWYRDANLTDVAHTGANFKPVVNATTTFYVTVQGSNQCENLKADAKVVTLTVNPPAVAADITVAGANTNFCEGNKARLEASSTTVTSPVFTWYTDAALTNAVHTGPIFEPTVTATITYYVTVRGTDRCENATGSAKVVTLTVNPPATAADIAVSGAETAVCEGASVKLTATSTTVTKPVFTWYTDAALTNAVHIGAVLEKTVTATTTYYVTVKGDGHCENKAGTAKTVTVTVNPLPNTPIVSANGTTICAEEATQLTVQNVQTGIVYNWYNVATGGSSIGTGATFTTPVLTKTTDYYVVATSSSGCGNATGRVKVTVTVSPKPGTPTVASGTVSTCIGSAAVLAVSNPVAGVTYNWYAGAKDGAILGSGAQFTTPVVTGSTITYYVGAQVGNCTSTSRTAVVVTAGAIPLPPPTVSGAAAELCPGSSTVLTVNNPDAALKYSWYTVATGGTAIANGTSFTVPALSATTIYYVGSSNNTTGCESASRTAVTVKVATKLDAPVVTTQTTTATSITFAWPAVTGAETYEVSMDNGLTWIAPSSGANGTSHLVSGLNPDQKVTIRVRAKGQLDCQTSDATTFTGQAKNPLGNEVFVPNTFTPNGDGKNDVLYVYGNTIAKMQLRVYNQWGQFLYESLNIQNGWDGTYKGQMQPNGVYVYYLEVEFNDGTKATKKGTITILR